MEKLLTFVGDFFCLWENLKVNFGFLEGLQFGFEILS